MHSKQITENAAHVDFNSGVDPCYALVRYNAGVRPVR